VVNSSGDAAGGQRRRLGQIREVHVTVDERGRQILAIYVHDLSGTLDRCIGWGNAYNMPVFHMDVCRAMAHNMTPAKNQQLSAGRTRVKGRRDCICFDGEVSNRVGHVYDSVLCARRRNR
jgi:hypothetical protein